MELKQNEALPAERQIVTAEPELKTVSFAGQLVSLFPFILNKMELSIPLSFYQVKLSEDDEFIVLACDGIWYVLTTTKTP
jgi:protein phosphatase 1G